MNKSLILRRHTCIQVDKKEIEINITEIRDDVEKRQRSDISTRQLHSNDSSWKIDEQPDVKKNFRRRSTATIAMSTA